MTTKITASVLANTSVTPGTYGGTSYPTIVVDGQGRITYAANSTYTSGVTAKTYGDSLSVPVISVDAQGRVTAVSNVAITTGAVITDDTSSDQSLYLMMGIATSGTYFTANTSSTQLYFNPSTGTLSSTIFNSLSDISKKTNISIIDNAVDTVNLIEGVEFNWIENNKKSSGVIAQQLEQILPHLVDDNNGIKSVNYHGLIAYLIESVKELSRKVEELEKK